MFTKLLMIFSMMLLAVEMVTLLFAAIGDQFNVWRELLKYKSIVIFGSNVGACC